MGIYFDKPQLLIHEILGGKKGKRKINNNNPEKD